MPLDSSLLNAVTTIEKTVYDNLPAGMTAADVEWFDQAGFVSSGKDKWARSTFTSLPGTRFIASGCATIPCLYTLQLFYKTPETGSRRNDIFTDLDALQSVFKQGWIDNVRIDSVSAPYLGKENDGVWSAANLIVNLSVRGNL